MPPAGAFATLDLEWDDEPDALDDDERTQLLVTRWIGELSWGTVRTLRRGQRLSERCPIRFTQRIERLRIEGGFCVLTARLCEARCVLRIAYNRLETLKN